MNIWERIFDLSKERGISGKKLCEMTEIPTKTFYNGKSENKSISIENLSKIAKVLGYSMDYIVNEKEFNLPTEESKLLDLYRKLPDSVKVLHLTMLENLVDQYATADKTK